MGQVPAFVIDRQLLTISNADDVLNVNAKGIFLVNQAVLPQTRARRYGRIVSIARQNLPDKASIDQWTERTCLGRLGDPEDVVGAVCFVASEESGYITGQSLNMCGGIIYD